MAKFYTQTGDDGFTGLLGEGREPKYDPRFEAIGAVDEANAAIGMARTVCLLQAVRETLLTLQKDLYHLMAELAATPQNVTRFRQITPDRVTWLEEQIDRTVSLVSVPAEFIVPGDSQAGAALDLARTIVRRAERQVASLLHHSKIENRELLRFLNRSSSLLFALELLENKTSGTTAPTLAKE